MYYAGMHGALLSGIFAGASFMFPALWPLSLIGLVPLLVGTENLTPRQRIYAGLVFAAILYGLALYAVMWHVLPLSWTNLSASAQFVLVAFFWTLSVIFLTLPAALWAVCSNLFSTQRWYYSLALASLWVVLEWCGAFVYALGTAGPHVTFGTYFSIPHLGNLIAEDLALLQIAYIGGVYGLSFFVALCNLLLYQYWRERGMKRMVIASIGIVCVVVWVFGHVWLAQTRNEGERIRVATIATRVPTTLTQEKKDVENAYERKLQLLSRSLDSDLVVLPEESAMITRLNFADPQRKKNMFTEHTPLIIDSELSTVENKTYKRIRYYDPTSDTSEYVYKRFLVLGGEYLPHAFSFASFLIPHDKLAFAQALQQRTFVSGPETFLPTLHNILVGARACNEVAGTELYREQVLMGAEILANLASQSWYHDSHLVHEQVLRMAKIRAVENRRFFIQASNSSPAFVLDAYGRVMGETSWGKEDVLFADVSLLNTLTPYTRTGSSVVVLTCFSIFLLGLFLQRRYS